MEILVFIGALIAGTGCSLTSKLLLGMKAVGASGEESNFENPLFQTWGMFLGMCAALPVHFFMEWWKRRGAAAEAGRGGGYGSINNAGAEKPPPPLPVSTYALLAIPALFDLLATALCMYGLTYIAVSIYQMLRGGAIVFVAILKHFMLGDKLAGYMWVGVFWNVISIVLVGCTAIMDPASQMDGKDPMVGVLLILSGAFVQSLQYAFEEKVMSTDVGAPPLLVIGMEGLWGTIVCTVVVYPLMTMWGVEDPYDTYVMFSNSQEIRQMFALYFLSIFLYNMLAVMVTFMLNSVWHAILDNFRPITVWGADLGIYYLVTTGFGEAWTDGSYIQAMGLVVLLYGTAVYNGSIRLSCFAHEYEGAGDLEEAAVATTIGKSPMGMQIRTPRSMASPSLGKSPLIRRSIERRNSDAEAEGGRGRTGSFGN